MLLAYFSIERNKGADQLGKMNSLSTRALIGSEPTQTLPEFKLNLHTGCPAVLSFYDNSNDC